MKDTSINERLKGWVEAFRITIVYNTTLRLSTTSLGFMEVFNFADSEKFILSSHSSLISKRNKLPETVN